MPSIYCSVRGCWGSTASKHRFPMPTKHLELFKKWVNLCRNERLTEPGITDLKIYNNCRVCRLHFTDNYFIGSKLRRTAYPSLRLQGDPELISVRVEDTSKEKDVRTIEMSSPSRAIGTNLETNVTVSKGEIICVDNSKKNNMPSTSSAEQNIQPDPHTPPRTQRRSSLLAGVNSTEYKNLTPKAKYLFKKAKYFKRKAIRSNLTRINLKQRLNLATKFTQSEAFEKVVEGMDNIKKRFFKYQLENVNKKTQGRRFSLDDKIFGIALSKISGTGYKFLSKLFVLPSRNTCNKLLKRIPIKPGLSESVFDLLKIETKTFKSDLEKYAILMFDEMSLCPNFSWDSYSGDIDGFEDYGYRRTDKIANHVQVFILRGIYKKWKQPIYYNFVNGATSYQDIMKIIKMIVQKCSSIGIKILATICDQGSNNRAAINNLVKETRERHLRQKKDWTTYTFEIESQSIFPLFDTPHLMKGLRNNFLKYDIVFKMDGERMRATWDDIVMAYHLDPYLGSLRMMPKLTEKHVNTDKINKMKVACCTQVFSRTVAVAINVMAISKTTVTREDGTEIKLRSQAIHTAKLIEFLDMLFDSMNGSSFNSDKLLKRAVTEETNHSIHHSILE